MKLEVGQKLYFDPHQRYYEYMRGEVTVTKVGRKWAELSNGRRISIETMLVDSSGYVSIGRCWLSEDEYAAAKELAVAWNCLRRVVADTHGRPRNISATAIKQMIETIEAAM